MRSMPTRVKTAVSMPTSCGWPVCERPPTPAYSPSVFSRTNTMSMSAAVRLASGVGMPGSRRAGRTFAHRSSTWRILRIIPQRAM